MSTPTDGVTRLYGSDGSRDAQKRALVGGEVPVAVYGLGKMGLPLAGVFADVTGNVIGADVDPEVVDTINAGDSHVKREPGLETLVADTVDAGALVARTDPAATAFEATIHVCIVPTLLDENDHPDLSILESVVEDIASGLDPGDQVVVESTVPPRTCRDVILPHLEAESDVDRGEFGVAFCPERTASGRALRDIRGSYPKVVGGVDDESTRVAELVYEEINDAGVISVSGATTAETVKIIEGLYRDVNIAFANELATFADDFGVDVTEAIDVANTAPYVDVHEPGPGVGGHCIPFYPHFVIDEFDTAAPLLQTARETNESMPGFTVAKVREELAAEGCEISDARVLIMGLTYRPGVEETRASPSLAIARELTDRGATVHGVDPVLDSVEEFALEPRTLEETYDCSYDAVVLVTPHAEFDDIEWGELSRDGGQLVVVDGRDALDPAETDCRLYTIGDGR